MQQAFSSSSLFSFYMSLFFLKLKPIYFPTIYIDASIHTKFCQVPSSLSFDDEKISHNLLMNSLLFSLRKYAELPIEYIRTYQNDCVFTWNIMSAESAGISGTKCSSMDQVKFLEEKIFGLLRQTASLYVF